MLFHLRLPAISTITFHDENPTKWQDLIQRLKHGQSQHIHFQNKLLGKIIDVFQDNKHFTFVIDTTDPKPLCTRLYLSAIKEYLQS